MAKTRKQKEKEVEWLCDIFGKMKSVVFADFTNLKVSEIQDLRRHLKKENAVLKVMKKKLFGIAIGQDKDLKVLKEEVKVEGPLSLAFGLEDEIAPARVLVNFKKAHKDLKILGGILDKRFLADTEILSLAGLPGLDEMRARVVGAIAAPVSGFVNVLAGNLRNLIYILKNISEKGAE